MRPGLQRPGQDGHFEGRAIVYDDVPEAIAGVQKGELKPGHVLVLRGCGPKGGPAMAGSASRVVFAIYAAGLENEVAFVSDGQLSGLCNKGMTVAEVSPESASGDRSRSSRMATAFGSTSTRACWIWMCLRGIERVALGVARFRCQQRLDTSIYQRSVQPMSTGAVLVTPEKR